MPIGSKNRFKNSLKGNFMKNQTPKELFVEYRDTVASLVNTCNQMLDNRIEVPIQLIKDMHLKAACFELWTKIVQRNIYKAGL